MIREDKDDEGTDRKMEKGDILTDGKIREDSLYIYKRGRIIDKNGKK